MSKYSVISDELKKEIQAGLYSVGGKLPTEYELVEKYKVSRQTIRQALSLLKQEGFLYQVQGSGTFIAQTTKPRLHSLDKQINVDVICTYISDYIFPSIIRGIEHKLSEKNYNCRLFATGNMIEKERRILEKVINGSDTDAIIVEGTKTGIPNPNIPLYEKIMAMGIPIVFLHCGYPELANAVVVGMDDYKGGEEAAQYLLDQGCKRLGGIFKIDDRQGLLRFKGFSSKIYSSSVNYGDCVIRWFTTEEAIRTNRCITEAQAREYEDVDGVVCYNDQIATAFIKDMSKYNIKLPKIVSFDKSHLYPSCNSINLSLGHRKDYLGEEAAKKIISMLNGVKEKSVFFDWMLS